MDLGTLEDLDALLREHFDQASGDNLVLSKRAQDEEGLELSEVSDDPPDSSRAFANCRIEEAFPNLQAAGDVGESEISGEHGTTHMTGDLGTPGRGESSEPEEADILKNSTNVQNAQNDSPEEIPDVVNTAGIGNQPDLPISVHGRDKDKRADSLEDKQGGLSPGADWTMGTITMHFSDAPDSPQSNSDEETSPAPAETLRSETADIPVSSRSGINEVDEGEPPGNDIPSKDTDDDDDSRLLIEEQGRDDHDHDHDDDDSDGGVGKAITISEEEEDQGGEICKIVCTESIALDDLNDSPPDDLDESGKKKPDEARQETEQPESAKEKPAGSFLRLKTFAIDPASLGSPAHEDPGQAAVPVSASWHVAEEDGPRPNPSHAVVEEGGPNQVTGEHHTSSSLSSLSPSSFPEYQGDLRWSTTSFVGIDDALRHLYFMTVAAEQRDGFVQNRPHAPYFMLTTDTSIYVRLFVHRSLANYLPGPNCLSWRNVNFAFYPNESGPTELHFRFANTSGALSTFMLRSKLLYNTTTIQEFVGSNETFCCSSARLKALDEEFICRFNCPMLSHVVALGAGATGGMANPGLSTPVIKTKPFFHLSSRPPNSGPEWHCNQVNRTLTVHHVRFFLKKVDTRGVRAEDIELEAFNSGRHDIDLYRRNLKSILQRFLKSTSRNKSSRLIAVVNPAAPAYQLLEDDEVQILGPNEVQVDRRADDILTCKLCNVTFGDDNELSFHLSRRHLYFLLSSKIDEHQYSCSMCGRKDFSNRCSLVVHMGAHHLQAKQKLTSLMNNLLLSQGGSALKTVRCPVCNLPGRGGSQQVAGSRTKQYLIPELMVHLYKMHLTAKVDELLNQYAHVMCLNLLSTCVIQGCSFVPFNREEAFLHFAADHFAVWTVLRAEQKRQKQQPLLVDTQRAVDAYFRFLMCPVMSSCNNCQLDFVSDSFLYLHTIKAHILGIGGSAKSASNGPMEAASRLSLPVMLSSCSGCHPYMQTMDMAVGGIDVGSGEPEQEEAEEEERLFLAVAHNIMYHKLTHAPTTTTTTTTTSSDDRAVGKPTMVVSRVTMGKEGKHYYMCPIRASKKSCSFMGALGSNSSSVSSLLCHMVSAHFPQQFSEFIRNQQELIGRRYGDPCKCPGICGLNFISETTLTSHMLKAEPRFLYYDFLRGNLGLNFTLRDCYVALDTTASSGAVEAAAAEKGPKNVQGLAAGEEAVADLGEEIVAVSPVAAVVDSPPPADPAVAWSENSAQNAPPPQPDPGLKSCCRLYEPYLEFCSAQSSDVKTIEVTKIVVFLSMAMVHFLPAEEEVQHLLEVIDAEHNLLREDGHIFLVSDHRLIKRTVDRFLSRRGGLPSVNEDKDDEARPDAAFRSPSSSLSLAPASNHEGTQQSANSDNNSQVLKELIQDHSDYCRIIPDHNLGDYSKVEGYFCRACNSDFGGQITRLIDHAEFAGHQASVMCRTCDFPVVSSAQGAAQNFRTRLVFHAHTKIHLHRRWLRLVRRRLDDDRNLHPEDVDDDELLDQVPARASCSCCQVDVDDTVLAAHVASESHSAAVSTLEDFVQHCDLLVLNPVRCNVEDIMFYLTRASLRTTHKRIRALLSSILEVVSGFQIRSSTRKLAEAQTRVKDHISSLIATASTLASVVCGSEGGGTVSDNDVVESSGNCWNSKTPLVPFTCLPCRFQCFDRSCGRGAGGPMAMHASKEAHLAAVIAVRKSARASEGRPPEDPSSLVSSGAVSAVFGCEMCAVFFTTLQELNYHVFTRRHLANSDTWPPRDHRDLQQQQQHRQAGGHSGGGGGQGPVASFASLVQSKSTCNLCNTEISLHNRLSHSSQPDHQLRAKLASLFVDYCDQESLSPISCDEAEVYAYLLNSISSADAGLSPATIGETLNVLSKINDWCSSLTADQRSRLLATVEREKGLISINGVTAGQPALVVVNHYQPALDEKNAAVVTACPICVKDASSKEGGGGSFSHTTFLLYHMLHVHNKKPLKHIRKVTNLMLQDTGGNANKPLICPRCTQRCASPFLLALHHDRHHVSPPLSCKHCGRAYDSPAHFYQRDNCNENCVPDTVKAVVNEAISSIIVKDPKTGIIGILPAVPGPKGKPKAAKKKPDVPKRVDRIGDGGSSTESQQARAPPQGLAGASGAVPKIRFRISSDRSVISDAPPCPSSRSDRAMTGVQASPVSAATSKAKAGSRSPGDEDVGAPRDGGYRRGAANDAEASNASLIKELGSVKRRPLVKIDVREKLHADSVLSKNARKVDDGNVRNKVEPLQQPQEEKRLPDKEVVAAVKRPVACSAAAGTPPLVVKLEPGLKIDRTIKKPIILMKKLDEAVLKVTMGGGSKAFAGNRAEKRVVVPSPESGSPAKRRKVVAGFGSEATVAATGGGVSLDPRVRLMDVAYSPKHGDRVRKLFKCYALSRAHSGGSPGAPSPAVSPPETAFKKCRQCQFTTTSVVDIFRHIKGSHLDSKRLQKYSYRADS